MVFVPLNTAAYLYLSSEQRLKATCIYNLLRNEGGSVGTSLSQTLLERREQFHVSRLTESLTPFDPALAGQLEQLTVYWKTIDEVRQSQALSLS
jgi:DHA2 family multidrug resistance protein